MNRMRRREFLRTYGLGAAAVAMGGLTGALSWGGSAARSKRPNIIVIMSDEHNASVTGCYGNEIVRTGNLDRLASEGVTFDACYTNSPLCVPSRLSFTAGKYVSRVGAWSNSCRLESDEYPSLPRLLNSAGYESYLCGKMHYDKSRRYGFTEIGGNMNSSSKTGRGGRRKADDLAPKAGHSGRFKDFHTGEDSSILRHDRRVTAGAVEFLKERRGEGRPFFLLVGYLAPHFPLIVPEEFWEHYRGRVPMPKIPAGHLESQVRNYKHHRTAFNTENAPDDITRRGRELYYGLTEWLDVEVGKVLGALKSSGFADETVVIYTTDHGENMGEHGLWWKNAMYEHAARVPLIVWWPSRWKGRQRRSGACSLVDVVQTIAELGGTKAPADWDGDSMAGWLDDEKAGWKDLAVSEYYGHNVASGFAMIRMGDYKYVYHTRADGAHAAERELYDLASDPGEFRNLADEPGQRNRIERMHAALVTEVGEEPDKTELRCRADYARGYKLGEVQKTKRRG